MVPLYLRTFSLVKKMQSLDVNKKVFICNSSARLHFKTASFFVHNDMVLMAGLEPARFCKQEIFTLLYVAIAAQRAL